MMRVRVSILGRWVSQIAVAVLMISWPQAATAQTVPAGSEAKQTGKDWAHQVKLPDGERPIELFNGKDLSGWEGYEKYFSVVDGMIRARNEQPVRMSTYLYTKEKYRQYRLLLEVKQTVGDNFSPMHSAVASIGKKVKNAGGDYGFEGMILMFCQDWGIWGTNGRRRIFPPDQKTPMKVVPWEKLGDWNQLEILVTGNRVQMVANGQQVIDHTETIFDLLPCPIGLQMHNENRTQEFFFRGLVLVNEPTEQLLTLKSKEG